MEYYYDRQYECCEAGCHWYRVEDWRGQEWRSCQRNGYRLHPDLGIVSEACERYTTEEAFQRQRQQEESKGRSKRKRR